MRPLAIVGIILILGGSAIVALRGVSYTMERHSVQVGPLAVTADEKGFLHFKAEQPGQYLLAVAHHREPIAGFHMGRPYQQTSHNAALSWLQTK